MTSNLEKVKLSLHLNKHYIMKMHGIASQILNFSTNWRWVVIFTFHLLLPLAPSTQDPLNRRVDDPQSQPQHVAERKIPAQPSNWTCWQTEKSLPLPMIEPWSSNLQSNHYIDWATLAPHEKAIAFILLPHSSQETYSKLTSNNLPWLILKGSKHWVLLKVKGPCKFLKSQQLFLYIST